MTTANILLVDDDRALLQALPRTISLRMSGVQVQTVAEADAALKLLQEQEYDAIVSDIKMPGMDGLELLAIAAEQYPETPVLLITGHGEHDLAIQALRGGAYDYILKPIDRDDFIASLQRALHTRQLKQQVLVQQRALEWYALSLERQVEQRTRELVAMNETKDALLSTVAHELASPLTGMRVMAMMVDRQLQRTDNVEKIRSTMSNMTRSMNRLERIVQDLQDTSLIHTHNFVLQRSNCDLVELGQQILEEFMAGEKMALDYQVLDEPIEVNVDSERISQALLNLLSNARKYSPEGAPIAVQVRKEGSAAIISVHDQGVGIPAELLSHIAEQFYRVPGIEVQTGPASGLGLGLYLTRKIVEQHGGHMQVHSQEGQGSTFSLVLPLAKNNGKS